MKAQPPTEPLLAADWLAYYRWVSQQPLTVVDLETTGRYPERDRMIEISVLQANLTDGIQHQQTHLINPELDIPARIIRFTGISPEMVESAPIAAEIWPKYQPMLNQGVLTAHNVAFDYGFLQAEGDRCGQPFARPSTHRFCTVKLARLLLAELPSRSLPFLVRYFQFSVGPSHRAEADTLACWLLAEKLLRQIQQESDLLLLQRFAQEWIPGYRVAAVLAIPEDAVTAKLEQAGIRRRYSRYRKSFVYPRGEVEQLRLTLQE